ncbi:Adenylyltransferase and sulfurtransferase MOCS3 [Vitis vinifera]|uniref:Adenylyltransferase and sulfurtransferase MOCS3 n=1 Tax=Vitis vinifera TaxID=29760 RepID=A0A438H664_VITVI|nr:Adenylyltransferase and sulfurtransferase MOCS3 [Vitis vinifera]
MESNGEDASRILREIETLKAAKADIEHRISVLEARLRDIPLPNDAISGVSCSSMSIADSAAGHGLSPDMIYRYSRHLLLPSFGVQGQSSLLKSSILVVGAGGLGAPALLYLAACGVGCIGTVDHDVVELNNLHRQIIHTEAYVGQPKVQSAAAACRSINSTIQIVEHKEALCTSNALEILSKYDLVIDATDNVPSRYMISDCCVVLGKPLVSGAALGLEGQLTVYNYKGGPCYRCLFPTPPPTTACQRCSDSGVLGVGFIFITILLKVSCWALAIQHKPPHSSSPEMRCLKREVHVGVLFLVSLAVSKPLEAIKIASAVGEPLSGRMLLFDALSARIRIVLMLIGEALIDQIQVKIRGRLSQCEVCGENATFTQQKFQDFDYEKFTRSPLSTTPLKLNLLPADSRITSKEYNDRLVNGEAHVLVDVRPSHHFNIVSLRSH